MSRRASTVRCHRRFIGTWPASDSGTMTLFGVHFIGVTSANGHKLLLSLAFFVGLLVLRSVVVAIVRLAAGHPNARSTFWTAQISNLVTSILIVSALVSIWIDDPKGLATPGAMVTAGLAFALQKVVTAFAGYVVIMRGKSFSVGDRITMGGVRGDVIALGFFQTTILEMGEPPTSDEASGPPGWVQGRQYTGRLVTVTNDKIFEQPIYNYTREFRFLMEELHVPVPYDADRAKAERILLECTKAETDSVRRTSLPQAKKFEEKYFVDLDHLAPRVFVRATEKWIDMTVRFMTLPDTSREVKDAITRRLMDAFEREDIAIAGTKWPSESQEPSSGRRRTSRSG